REIVGAAERAEPLHPGLEPRIASPLYLPGVADLGAGVGVRAEPAFEDQIGVRLEPAEFLLQHRPECDGVAAFGVIVRELGKEADVKPVLAGLRQSENIFPFDLVEARRRAGKLRYSHRQLALPPRSEAVADVEHELALAI